MHHAIDGLGRFPPIGQLARTARGVASCTQARRNEACGWPDLPRRPPGSSRFRRGLGGGTMVLTRADGHVRSIPRRVRRPPMDSRTPHRVTPMTRRDWLLHAGAGFGALALGDLLARDLSAGTEATPTPGRRTGALAAAGDCPERDLPVHGRRPEPHRYLRPQAGAEPARRPAAAAELQAGDHADGRGPCAAAGVAAEVEAARAERPVGLRLAAAHRHLRRRAGGDPLVLVQRAEPRRRRLPDEHRLDPRRPPVAGELGELRPGHRERQPARRSS